MLHCYGLFESGQMDVYLGADPPALLVDAVIFYHATVNRVRSDRYDRERKKREQKRGR